MPRASFLQFGFGQMIYDHNYDIGDGDVMTIVARQPLAGEQGKLSDLLSCCPWKCLFIMRKNMMMVKKKKMMMIMLMMRMMNMLYKRLILDSDDTEDDDNDAANLP